MQSTYKANNRLLRHRDRLRQRLKVITTKKASVGKDEIDPQGAIQKEAAQQRGDSTLWKWPRLTTFLIVLGLIFWFLWTFDWQSLIQTMQ